MKALSVLLLAIVIAPQACRAQQPTGSTSISEISYSINTNLLLSQDYFEKQGNKSISDKLDKVSDTFSQISEGASNVNPSSEYAAAFKGYSKVIASLKTTPQTSALQSLNDIQEDMEAKLQRDNSMKLDDKLTRPVKVKIVTRKIVNGKEVDVPGYIIKYKIWFLKDEKNPLFNFTNPTLSAEKSLTPGNYDIWAELPDSSKQYPQMRTRKRIPDVDGSDAVTIVLLIE